MKLRYSFGSPFARKTVMAAHALRLLDRLELVDHDADPQNLLRHANPLHKVPMLVADDGTQIYDSPVIVEYLDELAGGGRILPARGLERYHTLSRLALADGMAEATVLVRYESRWREPHQVSQRWIDHQRSKIERALDTFEAEPPQDFDAAAMGLACALVYLDAGPQIVDWPARCPKLAAWFDEVASIHPSFIATRPKAP